MTTTKKNTKYVVSYKQKFLPNFSITFTNIAKAEGYLARLKKDGRDAWMTVID